MKADALFDVTGRVAVVTGAASGLGLAFAEVLADNGAHVVLLDIDAGGLAAAAAQLDGAVETVEADVADRTRLVAAIDGIAAAHGRLDIVFANAGITSGPGIAFGQGQIETLAPEIWSRVLDVNLTGVFATLQAAAVPMKAQRSGRIVVTASIAGVRAERACGYGYVATKAAVINLVRQAAVELAPYNVSVNAIAPGPFRTNIAGGRLADPAVADVFARTVPMGRIAETAEIQGLALLLASPAASFITGAVIPIDGGTTAG